MKKVFIIEDNESDWNAECKMLHGKYKYYPEEVEEFKLVRKNIRRLKSENPNIRGVAKERIIELIEKISPDLFIIDYALEGMSHNAVYVLKILQTHAKTIIFTKHEHYIETIQKEVNEIKSTYPIKVMAKPYGIADMGSHTTSLILEEIEQFLNEEKEDSLNNLPTVLIMTAIREEWEAVISYLKEYKDDYQKNGYIYQVGYFAHNQRKIARIIVREAGRGNINATLQTERAINSYSPGMILFVGIAGSRKPKDFKVGDVIYPSKIYDYESGKADKDAFMARPDLQETTESLFEIAKNERKKQEWKILVNNDNKNNINAGIGVIASGEQLIEHYDSIIGKILDNHYNDTSAVETEGFGFAKAANNQKSNMSNLIIGVIRGISDILKQNNVQQNVIDTDRRPQGNKKLASESAAAFSYWLIYKYYEQYDKTI